MGNGRILLIGATDLAAAVARQLVTNGIPVVGIVGASSTFSISYRPSGMFNSRHVNMAVLASHIGAQYREITATDDLLYFAQEVKANLLIVAGWHKFVSKRLREYFPYPCLGLHASLLPRYRGGAPLNWTILNGDSEGGVSLFELADGIDEGAIYGQLSFPILDTDYIGDLVKRSEDCFLRLLNDTIPSILAGTSISHPQTGNVSYSLQRFPEDGLIEWNQPVARFLRLVRAISHPYPGAFTSLDGKKLFIWRASVCNVEIFGSPGQIAAPKVFDYPAVILSNGAATILEAQFDDGTNAIPSLIKAHNRRFDLFYD
jgi:methionyl-tRNA formyltransferase